MFAYCNNNPICSLDITGHYSQSIKGAFSTTYIGDVAASGGGVSAYISLTIIDAVIDGFTVIRNTISRLFSKKSDSIDWGAGNENHILKGTKGKHIPGWKRFGIDPNKGNNDSNWALLLPILQEVVDKADDYYYQTNPNGTTCYFYVKYYLNEGVKVVVKIWESIDGAIQQISDAIPYIID